MTYERTEFEQRVSEFFLGNHIGDVFYNSEYEGVTSYTELSEEVEEALIRPILIQLGGNKFVSIMSSDGYEPLQGYLSGIDAFDTIKQVNGRPSQIDKKQWHSYKGKRITTVEIIETTIISNKRLFLPFGIGIYIPRRKILRPLGIKLEFEDSVLYLFDLEVEGYESKKNIYTYSIGGAVTIFFSSSTVEKHRILSNFKNSPMYSV